MAPKHKIPAESRLKNGYIARERNAAGYLVYRAKPICSMDLYDICNGVGCPHRRIPDPKWRRRYYWSYGKYSWRFRNKAPFPWRPTENRRISLTKISSSHRQIARPVQWKLPDRSRPCYYLTNRRQPPLGDPDESVTKEGDKRRQQPGPTATITPNHKQPGALPRPSLGDDPIGEGRTLAKDADVSLQSAKIWLAGSETTRYSTSGATVEDKEIADLLRLGLLKCCDGGDGDIGLNDIVRPEPAYTIRYVSRKSPSKGRRKGSPELWEDNMVAIDDGWDWEWV
jgi:hypothetical protein